MEVNVDPGLCKRRLTDITEGTSKAKSDKENIIVNGS